MKDIHIQLSAGKIISILKRHHLTVFIIFVAATLATVVLLVNSILLNPPEVKSIDTPAGTAPSTVNSLEPLRNLHTSDELNQKPSSITTGGRTSPFTGKV